MMKQRTQLAALALLLSVSAVSFASDIDHNHGDFVGEKEVAVSQYASDKVKTCLYKGSTEEPVELKWGKTLTCPDSITMNATVIHEGDGLNTSGFKRQ
ncbi:hypothetical protein [Vibrio hangzhouensis]|uniref:hypothetical protein n=1 Tax=Vibrio hangzhouensis TaxID=462991 RepID=UPI001C96F025|nr:hypothetical protein [Vibrio hangzhouensis]MBY6195655.1 hypothetical protein [Vibrio hangzhouensis]